MKTKKGIMLSQAFPAVLAVVLVAILVIIAIYMMTTLSTSFPLQSSGTINESASITSTPYTLSNTTRCGYTNPTISAVYNQTSGAVVAAGNYTFNPATSTITNATALQWPTVYILYNYQWRGEGCTATTNTITQFATYPALIGLIGVIIFLALVIGVLVSSFMRGRRGV